MIERKKDEAMERTLRQAVRMGLLTAALACERESDRCIRHCPFVDDVMRTEFRAISEAMGMMAIRLRHAAARLTPPPTPEGAGPTGER